MPIKHTTEQFIKQAQEIHGDKYTYELVEYTHSRNKVKINCPSHGIFEQLPTNHLAGSGCSICSGIKATQAKVASDFVQKAQLVHGDRYDYSLVEYKNNKTKVKINCPIHGEYSQKPTDHLTGHGCAKCALSEKGWTRTKFKDKCIKNNNGLGILYILECFNENERFIKIGITSRTIQKRYQSTKEMPYAYRVIDEIIGSPEFIYDLEIELHKQHKEHHYEPNIPFGGSSTECFKQYITNNIN